MKMPGEKKTSEASYRESIDMQQISFPTHRPTNIHRIV